MARTKLDRQLDLLRLYKSRLLSAYREAKGKYSFEWVLEQHRVFVWEDARYNKLPQWAKYTLRGYSDALLSMNYQNLQWAHIYDGQFTLSLPYGEGFDQKKVQDSFHVWKDTTIKF